MNGAMTTMLTTLSKFINMGMTLEDVILRATWNPARQIKREDLGHLSTGAPADIAVLRLVKGSLWICRREWSPHAGNTEAGSGIDREQRESRMGPQRNHPKRLEDVGPL